MEDSPDTSKRTERLGFRVEPETAEKIRALADVKERPYADLLREKTEELVSEYDRIMARAAEKRTAA